MNLYNHGCQQIVIKSMWLCNLPQRMYGREERKKRFFFLILVLLQSKRHVVADKEKARVKYVSLVDDGKVLRRMTMKITKQELLINANV